MPICHQLSFSSFNVSGNLSFIEHQVLLTCCPFLFFICNRFKFTSCIASTVTRSFLTWLWFSYSSPLTTNLSFSCFLVIQEITFSVHHVHNHFLSSFLISFLATNFDLYSSFGLVFWISLFTNTSMYTPTNQPTNILFPSFPKVLHLYCLTTKRQ